VDREAYFIVEKAQKTINEHHMLDHTEKVLVALSGGADSVCLLGILLSLSKKLSFEVLAAHVNHQLRGEDAEADEEFVRDLCQKWDVPLFVKKADVALLAHEQHISVETAGRNVRYDFFDEICDENDAIKIATAHHQNDQAETILMHMIRGAGLSGLAGIPYMRQKIIRPLLDVTRAEIEEYLRVSQIPHREDKTNKSLDYTRNRIRHELLPQIESYNPHIVNTMANNARFLQDDEEFIEHVTKKTFEECLISRDMNRVVWNRSRASQKNRAILSRLLLLVLDIMGVSASVSHDMVLLFEKKIKSNQTEHMQVHNLLSIHFVGDAVIFELANARDREDFCYDMTVGKDIYIAPIDMWIRADLVDTKEKCVKNVAYFDYDKIMEPMQVRSKQDGDRFFPVGMQGSKTVKKFLTDLKIPMTQKKCVPIVISGEKIVWIGNLRRDSRFEISKDTQKVLKIELWEGNKEDGNGKCN